MPFASDHTARASTASVVTLMPPAVDADPPPTNMSIEPTMSDEPLSSPMSTTENPPERVIADRKNDWKTVSQAFMLAEGRRVVVLQGEEGRGAGEEEQHRRDQGELRVQRPMPDVPLVPPERVDDGESDGAEEHARHHHRQEEVVRGERGERRRRWARSRCW